MQRSGPVRVASLLMVGVFAATAVGCGLERPNDPPPFDCERIDRAEERFPEECGPAPDASTSDPDAGT